MNALFDLTKDIWDFLRVRKKYWLAPLIITIVLMGALIVFTQGSVVAPFIYSIFWSLKMKLKKASKLVFINFGVFLLFLGFAEIFCRAYEFIFPGSQYQYRLQEQMSQKTSSCKAPPIVTDSGKVLGIQKTFLVMA